MNFYQFKNALIILSNAAGAIILYSLTAMFILSFCGMMFSIIVEGISLNGEGDKFLWLKVMSQVVLVLSVAIPFIVIMLAMSLAPLKDIAKFRKENRILHNRCISCNYDLRGSRGDECPECGVKCETIYLKY